jgi:hypothetical protein
VQEHIEVFGAVLHDARTRFASCSSQCLGESTQAPPKVIDGDIIGVGK